MDMWGQANHFIPYWDWHSVVMASLWSEMRHVYPGPQSMLVLEDVLFCIGVILILDRRGRLRSAFGTVLLLAAIVTCPPVFAYLGTIGKDSLLASSLVLTVGLLQFFSRYRRLYVLILGLITGFLAFAARQNAVFALMPLLFLFFWEALGKHKYRKLLSVMLLSLSVASYIGLNSAVKMMLHVRPGYIYQSIPLYDLADLSVETGNMLVPQAFLSPAGSLDNLRKSTNARYINTLIWPWGQTNPLKFSSNPRDVHELLFVWVSNAFKHPLMYLRWRWHLFASLAGLNRFVTTPFAYGVVPNPAGVRLHDTWMVKTEQHWLLLTGNSLLFRIYLYTALLVALLGWGIWNHDHTLSAAAMSGLSFLLAYFIIGVNSEFRFACYTMFIAVVLLARWLRDHSPMGRRSPALLSEVAVSVK